jgi:benzoyl-CoA 2,3-dioxygenase component B
MLTEEAHHMFVGVTGVERIVERTCQAMRDAGITDPEDAERIRALGVVDLPALQRKMNLHFSLTLDLFGNEVSTNAATAYNAGVKGRYREDKLDDDHRLLDATYPVLRCVDGAIVAQEVPALSGLNMRLRDDYVVDAQGGVTRWNKAIEKLGVAWQFTLPHVAHNRAIGEFAGIEADPSGLVMSKAEWAANRDRWLPSVEDNLFIASLMQPVNAAGAYAGWIAPPKVGIDNKPGNFEYVKLWEA